MQHRILIFWLVSAVLTCFISIDGGVECRRRYKYCNIDHLTECFYEPMAYLTVQPNATGIAYNNEQYEQYCFNMHDYFPYCVKNWATRCASPIHIEIVQRGFGLGYLERMKSFCDPNGYIRQTLLKHAKCINRSVKLSSKYRNSCIWQYQANYEFEHQEASKKLNLVNFIRGFCCNHNLWESCIVKQIADECGKEASNVFPELVGSLMTSMYSFVCPRSAYNENNTAICQPSLYKAPLDFVPLGINSDSYFSFSFSYVCNNAGFGFEKERDKASIAANLLAHKHYS